MVEAAYASFFGAGFGILAWIDGEARSVPAIALTAAWYGGAWLVFVLVHASIQVVRRRRQGATWTQIFEKRRSHEEYFVVDRSFPDVVSAGERAVSMLAEKEPKVERRRGRVRVRTGRWWLDLGDEIDVQVARHDDSNRSRIRIRSAPRRRGDFGPDRSREHVNAVSHALRTDLGADAVHPDHTMTRTTQN